MDSAAFIGIALGIAALLGGNFLEGGRLASILHPTAALIVFGGTFGATILSFPLPDIAEAVKSFRDVFYGSTPEPGDYRDTIIEFALKARKKGLLSLESELDSVRDPFLKRAIKLAIDGIDPRILREMLEQEIISAEQRRKKQAKVFETAGGFSPTIGIIGAVLGLIHVMENLSEPARLGEGIAVAFVATIYGVGAANLLLLPVGKKLQNIMRQETALKEMCIEGAIGIQTGMSPYYLKELLNSFTTRGGR